MGNLTGMVTRQGFWNRKAVVILIALLIGSYISARFALHLVSLIDTTRLVPVSGEDVLGVAPLAFLLYVLGIGAVIRFRIPHSVEWFSLLYAIRTTAALLLTMIVQADDEMGFHYAGMEQVYGILSFGAGRAYYHLVNTLYSIFGPNILLPKMFNVFLGSLLPFLAFDIAYWLFKDRKAAWQAFWITGFLPPFVYFSAVNLKEIATGFLFVLLVWVLANPKGGYLRRLLSSGACILALYWLRGAPWTIIAIAGVIAYIILGET